MNRLIQQAGAWALGQFRADPTRWGVRAAVPVDAPLLAQISATCFQRVTPQAQAHAFVSPNGQRSLNGGVLLKALIERDARPVAYMLMEWRPWAELYIYEMAALPPPQGGGVGCPLGPLMLAIAAWIAREQGANHLTANLSGANHTHGGRHQQLMLVHSLRHGMVRSDRRGVLFDGGRQPADDIWLTAPWQSIFSSLQAKYFERKCNG